MKEFIYERNETMKMLGHQTTWNKVALGGVAQKDFDNVLDAVTEEYGSIFKRIILNAGIYFFALGYIYGQRAERAKKKGLSQETTETTK